jgi:T5SS/PEP-CTERM-associated repeat protein
MRVSDLKVGAVGLGALSIYLTNVVPAVGAVTPTGDTTVETSGFTTIVGNNAVGTLTIDAQSTLTNAGGQIGVGPSGQGTATVRDANSLWQINGNLYAGYFGQGSLNILAGGRVESATGGVGYEAGSVGSATVSGAGSTWSVGNLYVGMLGTGDLNVSDGGLITAAALFAPLSRLHGNGTIEARGLISDIDLRFDNTHSTAQTFAFGSGGSLNLNVNGTGSLGAGMAGVGSLRIADGKVINSNSGISACTSAPTGQPRFTAPAAHGKAAGTSTSASSGRERYTLSRALA